jgi:hypothetical protein
MPGAIGPVRDFFAVPFEAEACQDSMVSERVVRVALVNLLFTGMSGRQEFGAPEGRSGC